MVRDQKPSTGGNWPLSKCMTYLLGAHVRFAIGVGFGRGVDGVFRAVGAEADRGDEGPLQIVGAVQAGFGREGPAVDSRRRPF